MLAPINRGEFFCLPFIKNKACTERAGFLLSERFNEFLEICFEFITDFGVVKSNLAVGFHNSSSVKHEWCMADFDIKNCSL